MTPRRTTVFRVSLASAIACLLFAPASATMSVRIPIEDMTHLASDVVVGKVASVESRYTDDRAQILTYVTLTRPERLKGGGSGDLVFVQWGGQVGDDALTIVGAPTFEIGEEVVVFLSAMKSAYRLAHPTDRWLLGLSQGKWRVTADPVSGERVAVNAAGEHLVGLPTEAAPNSIPLARLSSRVRAAAVLSSIRELEGE